MTDTHEDHVNEAKRLLTSRVADMRGMLDLANDEDTSEARRLANEYGTDDDWRGSEAASDIAGDYGLTWERVSANFRDETVTYSHQLSTGGPGDEFLVTFEAGSPFDGSHYVEWTVSSVVYVYLPWFDRVEIDALNPFQHTGEGLQGSPYAHTQCETVRDFYTTFFAEFVGEDNQGVFG